MQNLKKYVGYDERVAYVKETLCNKCHTVHKDFYDKVGSRLYSSKCDCEIIKEKEDTMQKVSSLLYGKIAIENNYAHSGLSSKELKQLKERYLVDDYNRKAYLDMIEWTTNYSKETKRGFMYIGKTGTGKTRLVLEVMDILLNKGVKCYFTTAQSYLNAIKQRFNDSSVPDVIKLARSVDVLILDDIGAEQGTTFDKAQILSLIGDRAGDKPTFITTNLNKEGLGKFYRGESETSIEADRVISRIIDSVERIYTLNGKDYRVANYKQRVKGEKVENNV